MRETPTYRRLILRQYAEFAAVMALYVVVTIAALRWLAAYPASPWRTVVALAPVIPIVLGAWTVVRLVRRMDERHQRMQLESLAFAFVGSALAVITYGFLEEAGFPRPSAWWVWMVMALLWAVSSLVTRIRYR